MYLINASCVSFCVRTSDARAADKACSGWGKKNQWYSIAGDKNISLDEIASAARLPLLRKGEAARCNASSTG